jgi:O-antigen/teichoic acid export membrane protein
MGIVLARTLGPAGKGALSVAQQIAGLGSLVLGFGFSAAYLYLAARREARGRDAVALSLLIGLGATVPALAVLLVAGDVLAASLLKSAPMVLLVVGALMIGPTVAGQALGAFVIGAGSLRNAASVNVGSLVFQFVSYTVLWAFGRLDVVSAVAVWTFAVLGSGAAQGSLAWRVTVEPGQPHGVPTLFRRSYQYALRAWPGAVLGNMALRVDLFLLAYYVGTAAVGVYSIAVTLAELCWHLPSAIGGVLAPKAAAEGRSSAEVTVRIARVVWVGTAVLGIVIAVTSVFAVPVLFGQAFSGAVLPLALLLPGVVAMSLAYGPFSYLSGIGKPQAWTVASGVNLAVNIPANVILIPRFGAAGAAAASSISYAVAAAVVIVWFVVSTGVGVRDVVMPRAGDFREFGAAALRALRRGN